ncbi:lipopolysaccharide biosynthesis protein [Krasilnikovia sp. MM14-A1004]|uniref:lipopolysaccharide biosynthesis protein n=1 Tax=Krasilnikovia sp. MM14-A1004 TaxID=3373541 RepID=UPI00399CFC95
MLLRHLHGVFTRRGLELAAVLTAVASLLAGVLIARMLGPSGRGQLVVVATWGQALAWVGGLSVDKALMARNSSDGRRQTDMPVASGLLVLLFLGGIVAIGSVFGSAEILASPVMRVALAVAVLGTVAFDARAAHLLVHDRWREFALLRFAQPATYLVGSLCAAALTAWHAAAGVHLFVVALCLSLWAPAVFVGGLPRPRIVVPRKVEMRPMFAFAGGYHVGSVLSYLSSRIDLMVVSVYFSAADVGLYSVASTMGQLAMMFGSANLIRGITGKLKSTDHVDRGGLAAAGLLTLVVAGGATWLLTHVYGPEFTAGGGLARWLCLGGLLFYLRHGFNGQLTGVGKPWATAAANGIGVAGFLVFLPLMRTTTEVAVVSVAATALSTAVAYLLLRHHTRHQAGEAGSVPATTARDEEPVPVAAAPAVQPGVSTRHLLED